MNLTKTLTIHATADELKCNLEAYQTDQISDMLSERTNDQGAVSLKSAVKFAIICLNNSNDSRLKDVVAKTGTPWIDTPIDHTGWVEVVTNYPYIFGITDDVVTDDIEGVLLCLDGVNHDVTRLIEQI